MAYPVVYAAKAINKKIVRNSSSGGLFFCLASIVINDFNGVVYGCSLCNGKAVHERVTSLSEISKLMKSKYIKSDVVQTFSQCAADLIDSKTVLYVGAPCQIFALKVFLEKKGVPTTNLITVDFICHGAPNQATFDKYAKEMGFDLCKHQYIFRDKKTGWKHFSVSCGDYSSLNVNDPYYYLFLHNYILDNSCYKCIFKGENRKSDITIGDFWNAELSYPDLCNDSGLSVLIIRNQNHIIDLLLNLCFVKRVDYGLALHRNRSYFIPSKKPSDYEKINNLIDEHGFTFACKTFNDFQNKRSFLDRLYDGYLRTLTPKNGNESNKINQRNKKYVGIITDFGYVNFGNRLQNFALLSFLEKNGYEPINIFYDTRNTSGIASLPLRFKRFIRDIKTQGLRNRKKYRQIKKCCNRYEQRPIKFFLDKKRKNKLNSLFSTIIVGSDQVWNYKYHFDIDFTLGNFQINNPAFSIISYSASISNSTIDSEFIPLFRESLEKFKAISLREKSGVEIINEMGFNSVFALDPTLLLDKQEWETFINKYSKIRVPNKKYVVAYFLSKDKETRNMYYKQIPHDVYVVDLTNTKDNYYCINHFDFLKLIQHASCVFTDSFHSSLFSILFNKNLRVFKRVDEFGVEKMGERIKTLFSIFNLSETLIGTSTVLVDNSTFEEKISLLRQKSRLFLLDNVK